MRRMDRTIKAFMLLELICVIAIIALLMALLMPSLSRVKKIATHTICGTFYYMCSILDGFPNDAFWTC